MTFWGTFFKINWKAKGQEGNRTASSTFFTGSWFCFVNSLQMVSAKTLRCSIEPKTYLDSSKSARSCGQDTNHVRALLRSDLLICANDNCRRVSNLSGSSNGKVRKPLLLFWLVQVITWNPQKKKVKEIYQNLSLWVSRPPRHYGIIQLTPEETDKSVNTVRYH